MMKEYQPQHKTLNALHFPAPTSRENDNRSFHFFSKLPVELRIRVWKMSHVSRRRLMAFRITHQDITLDREGGAEKKFIALPCGLNFSIDHKPRRIHLFSVNRESRQIAQEQYRIPLYARFEHPNWPISSTFPGNSDSWDLFEGQLKQAEDEEVFPKSQHETHPIMWLNPDEDIIFLPGFEVKTECFMEFINAFTIADPRGIGLLHLAFDSYCPESLAGLQALDPTTEMRAYTIDMFRKSVSRIKSLWFVHLLDSGSRIGGGPLSGTPDFSMGLDRSIPIMPCTVEFDLFSRDPRPVEHGLRGKTVFSDPKVAVAAWVAMEEKLGFPSGDKGGSASRPPTGPIREISHILAMSGRRGHSSEPSYGEVRCAGSMKNALRTEQDQLDDLARQGEFWEQVAKAETEERKRNLLSAAGFWVFPRGTFDTIHLRPGYEGKLYQDLRGKQPGLGLFEL